MEKAHLQIWSLCRAKSLPMQPTSPPTNDHLSELPWLSQMPASGPVAARKHCDRYHFSATGARQAARSRDHHARVVADLLYVLGSYPGRTVDPHTPDRGFFRAPWIG